MQCNLMEFDALWIGLASEFAIQDIHFYALNTFDWRPNLHEFAKCNVGEYGCFLPPTTPSACCD